MQVTALKTEREQLRAQVQQLMHALAAAKLASTDGDAAAAQAAAEVLSLVQCPCTRSGPSARSALEQGRDFIGILSQMAKRSPPILLATAAYKQCLAARFCPHSPLYCFCLAPS